MTAWLHGKVGPDEKPTCPRCGAPSSETSMLCEPHRLEAADRQARYAGRVRPDRRRLSRCAFCEETSSTYRCAFCKAKRRRWDLGMPIGEFQSPAPDQAREQEPEAAAPSTPPDPDER